MRFCVTGLTTYETGGMLMPGSSLKSKLLRHVLAKWGWATRGVTLGVRTLVIDGENRVLLVRHGYAPGWHLPGGAVDPGETIADAALRELVEETGVAGEARGLALHGVFFNPAFGGRDHVVVFRVTRFVRGLAPAPNREIVERGWFPLDALPEGVTGATLRRLAEVEGRTELSHRW